jgi:hypothetical protein
VYYVVRPSRFICTCIYVRGPYNGSRSKVLTWRVGIKKGITGSFL